MRRLLTVVCIASLCSARPSEAMEPLQPKDIFGLQFALAPEISPDGKWLVYTKMSSDILADKSSSKLWLARLDASAQPLLVESAGFAGGATWAPDGRSFAYVAVVGGPPEIRIFDVATGKSRQLAQMENGFPENLSWSPDAGNIAFSLFLEAPGRVIGVMPEKPPGAKWAKPAIVVDRLSYREADGSLRPNGRYQLFTLDVASGQVRQVTNSERSIGTGGEPIGWTRDNQYLIAVGNERSDEDRFEWETNLYRVRVAGGSIEQITRKPSYEGQLAVSPDGRHIAYVGYNPGYPGNPEQRQATLYVTDIAGGEPRAISARLDQSVGGPKWASDSKSVFGIFDERGVTKVGRFEFDGSYREVARDLGSYYLAYTIGASFSVADDGTIAHTLKTAEIPGDIALTRPDSPEPTQVTRLNDALFSQRAIGEVREINYTSSAGQQKIQGWYILPPKFDRSKTYPLLLEIHGGPYANYGPRFDIEKQLYAAAGYVVLYVNQRGSTSYGTPFIKTLHLKYPGKDVDDLASGIEAIGREVRIDPARIYVAGGSGGGILAGALLAKYPQLFRAAAILYPISDWRSYVLSAASWIEAMSSTFSTTPWANDGDYFRRSIISGANRIKSPTLIMVGENDFQTPVAQAEALYRALKWNGVDTALVIVPDESHGIRGRPSHFVGKMTAILGWFASHDEVLPDSSTK